MPPKKEPDFLFRHEGRIIGVEATTAAYSEDFLRREHLLGACLRRKIDFIDRPWESCWDGPFDLQLLQSIQKAVHKKLQKSYQGCDELIICVYVRATITSENDLLDIFRKVTLPPAKPASRVFAYCRTHDTQTQGFLIHPLV